MFDGQVSATRWCSASRAHPPDPALPDEARRAPLGLANPVWVDDDDFDPDRHVRRVGLPAPGGDAELCELVGHLLSEPLDRARPLWQLTVVEGLAGGRTALVAKMHHALVDGVAAVDVSIVILDPTPSRSS